MWTKVLASYCKNVFIININGELIWCEHFIFFQSLFVNCDFLANFIFYMISDRIVDSKSKTIRSCWLRQFAWSISQQKCPKWIRLQYIMHRSVNLYYILIYFLEKLKVKFIFRWNWLGKIHSHGFVVQHQLWIHPESPFFTECETKGPHIWIAGEQCPTQG